MHWANRPTTMTVANISRVVCSRSLLPWAPSSSGFVYRLLPCTPEGTNIRKFQIELSVPSTSQTRSTCTIGYNINNISNVRSTPLITNSIISKQFFSTSEQPSLIELIKQLRSSTGAPISDCKRALIADGVDMDIAKAMDWLRSHGSARVSSKVSGREALEGLIGLALSPHGAALVKISSETDFASRSDVFAKLAGDVAEAALKSGEMDMEKLMGVNIGDKTVKEAVDGAVLSIRENLQLVESSVLSGGEKSVFVGYVHGKAPSSMNAGKAAAVVELVSTDSSISEEEIKEAGKRLAMHIVAAKPEYLSPDDVPSNVVEKEKSILTEQVADSGKPPNIVEKIVNGRMRKFYEGVCLTEQSHMIEEDNPKVSSVLKKMGLEIRSYKSISI